MSGSRLFQWIAICLIIQGCAESRFQLKDASSANATATPTSTPGAHSQADEVPVTAESAKKNSATNSATSLSANLSQASSGVSSGASLTTATPFATPTVVPAPSFQVETDEKVWKKLSDESGIRTYQERVSAQDVVAFRGETIIPAAMNKIATVLRDESIRKEWVDSLEETKTLERFNELEQIEYNHSKVPWPFQDRDFVYRVKVKVNRDLPRSMMINMASVVSPLQPNKSGIVRGEILRSYYFMKEIPGATPQTQVVIEMALDPKGAIPMWMVNLTQKKWPHNTLLALKKISSREDLVVPKEIEDYFSVSHKTGGKKMNSKWILAIAMAFAMNANAAVKLSEEARIIDPSHLHLKLLSQNPDLVIDHVSSLGYEVYGPEGLKTYLTAQNISYLNARVPMTTSGADYPTAEASDLAVQNLAKKYPALITLTVIGKSVEGRNLTFVRITAPANQGTVLQDRPEFKYIANMHGDEIVGRELMVSLIDDLASKYGTDSRITDILNSTQVYIMASMNPDGATHKVRYNAHGTDLNRSFPDFTTADNQNVATGREPEIQAVMAFQAAHHFKLSANFHGGSQVVNYPWDTQAAPFPLDNLVQKISLDYAKRVGYLYSSTEFQHGITNGYAWYEVDGGMQDWSYNWYKDLQLTIELTNTKWPAFSSVAGTYQANRDALLALIEDIHQF